MRKVTRRKTAIFNIWILLEETNPLAFVSSSMIFSISIVLLLLDLARVMSSKGVVEVCWVASLMSFVSSAGGLATSGWADYQTCEGELDCQKKQKKDSCWRVFGFLHVQIKL